MIVVARSNRSLFGSWWWTVDRVLMLGFAILALIGLILLFAASGPIAIRNNNPATYFVSRQAMFLSASLILMMLGSMLSPRGVLRLSLGAIGDGSVEQREVAIAANLGASTKSPGQAITAIMLLSGLGAPEHSLEVARGFLLRRGQLLVEQRHPAGQPPITDSHHRMAMMLWIPASSALRMHPGFKSLCEGIGLVDYWRQTGNRPDFRGGSLRNM